MTVPPATKSAPVYGVASVPEGFVLRRNGDPLKTPKGAALVVPTASLADAMAGEWRTMKIPSPGFGPFTQLAFTAIDITGKDRGPIAASLAAYTESELLCHRADQPETLVRRQQEVWQPVLDWCAQRFGAALRTGTGIMPITQSPEARAALRRAIETYDDFRLTGLRQVVDVSGSLVLGLALAEQRLNAAQVFEAAELDASFQIEKWGEDPALAKRREGVRKDLALGEAWFSFLS